MSRPDPARIEEIRSKWERDDSAECYVPELLAAIDALTADKAALLAVARKGVALMTAQKFAGLWYDGDDEEVEFEDALAALPEPLRSEVEGE